VALDHISNVEDRTTKLTAEVSLIAGDLERVVHDSEPEFLEMGSKLMDFAVRAGTIAQDASSLVQATSGDDVADDIAFFEQNLNNFGGVCNSEDCEKSLQELHAVSDIINKLKKLITEFGPIVKKLQMLGISTRIESARLGEGGAGFITLADDVEKLAEKITFKSERVMTQCESLFSLVEDAAERMEVILKGREESREVVESTFEKNVSSLVSLVEHSKEAAERIQRDADLVSRDISHIVSSIQFHDIVRQQVEHVVEAIQDVLDITSARKTNLKETSAYIDALAELQVLQLDNASSTFKEAVADMISSLSGISQTMDTMVLEIQSLQKQGDGSADGGVLETIERTTESALNSMLKLSDSADELGSMMKSVAKMVGEITLFVEEIEDVGSEIELISLNASIKAAHTGEEGRALGVLAQAVQSLSYEAMETTKAVSEVLIGIAEVSKALEGRSDKLLDTDSLKDMQGEQQEHLRNMQRNGDKTLGAIAKVDGAGSLLSSDIQNLIHTVRFHDQVCGSLENAGKRFADIRKDVADNFDEKTRRESSEEMRRLLARYTMEEERRIHEKSLSTGETSLAENVAGAGDASADDWDNVELF
jgi:methyl-accepting chemotaxis protein